MEYFRQYRPEELRTLVNIRAHETKLGEVAGLGDFSGKFVIIGIPEDIGVKANSGIGGTDTLWPFFLKAFLNIQSTDLLSGEELSVAGYFDFSALRKNIRQNLSDYRKAVEEIDKAVEKVILEIAGKSKIPIIIGGGHNNCYPIIKGVAKASFPVQISEYAAINCINLDAHSDFRIREGRHSGNGFRYAYEEGFLKKYAIIGLHENYNSQQIQEELLTNPDIDFTYWEDIFLRESISFKEAVDKAIAFTSDNFTGIELDLDCVENVLSSAITPVGLSALQARQFVYQVSQKTAATYLHICEGAISLENGLQNHSTGKLVSYLVSDFIKGLRHSPV